MKVQNEIEVFSVGSQYFKKKKESGLPETEIIILDQQAIGT